MFEIQIKLERAFQAHEERSTGPSAPAAKASPEKFFMSLFQEKEKSYRILVTL